MGYNGDDNVGWKHQECVYIVMYPSRKTGGTYTEVRRTVKGLNRLRQTLSLLGYREEEIVITEQKKVWMPETKQRKNSSKGKTTNKSGKTKSSSDSVSVVVPFEPKYKEG